MQERYFFTPSKRESYKENLLRLLDRLDDAGLALVKGYTDRVLFEQEEAEKSRTR